FAKIGVDATPRIVRTLSDGNFVVRGLTAGPWLLRIASDADGDGIPERSAIRAVQIGLVTAPSGASQLSSVVLGDITLDGTAVLVGTVKNPGGDPAPGARVVVYRNTTELDAKQNAGVGAFAVDLGAEQITGSDENGKFRLAGVSRGKVRVAAVSEDGSLASAPVSADAEAGAPIVVADILL